jgi:hypothetical protein
MKTVPHFSVNHGRADRQTARTGLLAQAGRTRPNCGVGLPYLNRQVLVEGFLPALLSRSSANL